MVSICSCREAKQVLEPHKNKLLPMFFFNSREKLGERGAGHLLKVPRRTEMREDCKWEDEDV